MMILLYCLISFSCLFHFGFSSKVYKEECTLLLNKGNCASSETRWYFDNTRNKCVAFYYSGCGGNGNNFPNKTICEKNCQRIDHCQLPFETGNCTNQLTRWYYDKSSNKCFPFYYSGCGDNGNNFDDKKSCEKGCQKLNVTTVQIDTTTDENDTTTDEIDTTTDENDTTTDDIDTTTDDVDTTTDDVDTTTDDVDTTTDDVDTTTNDVDTTTDDVDTTTDDVDTTTNDVDTTTNDVDTTTDDVDTTTNDVDTTTDKIDTTTEQIDTTTDVADTTTDEIGRTTYTIDITTDISDSTTDENNISTFETSSTTMEENITSTSTDGCKFTTFGCCPDKETPAKGRFNKGCPPTPRTCNETKYGCCSDGLSAATGPNEKGCPKSLCGQTLFGCCSDNKTTAQGNDYEGCETPPFACASSKFGCCPDNSTAASGPDNEGCSKCTSSKYGCCPDGVSEAQSYSFDGCDEEPDNSQKQDTCLLPFVTGECSNYEIKWHYNHEDQRCEQFYYGGCGGNSNNFQTEELCLQKCVETKTTTTSVPTKSITEKSEKLPPEETGKKEEETCKLPSVTGDCDKYEVRWYYNTIDERCEPFYYGGCGGNSNNFMSEELCLQQCGDVKSTVTIIPTKSTIEKSETLRPKETVEEEEDTCKLPSLTGNCDKYEVRWYYNTTDERCEPFYYGGCGGNSNNFMSEELCLQQCGDTKKTSLPIESSSEKSEKLQPEETEKEEDTCKLPSATGECDKYEIRWYYNNTDERCERFYYGGCGGNSNNYLSEELCLQKCGDTKTTITSVPKESTTEKPEILQPKETVEKEEDTCKLPSVTGDCDKYEVRWYYNTTDQRCEPFYYGGCGGNSNNFLSEELCLQQCRDVRQTVTIVPKEPTTEKSEKIEPEETSEKEEDTCKLPSVTGDCDKFEVRWYYNTTDQRCEPFYYGGCGGNSNNYLSEELCLQKCGNTKTTITSVPKESTTVKPEILQPKETVEKEEDTCKLPSVTGDCDKYDVRWYYNNTDERCERFYYGGCGGNSNNYLSEELCLQKCGDTKTTITSVPKESTTEKPEILQPKETIEKEEDTCKLPSVTGDCDKYEVRWYYNTTDQRCEPFYYGGCGGNSNNFLSEELCLQQCGEVKQTVTIVPKEPTTEKPEEVQPEETDEKEQNTCTLPSVTGECDKYEIRWYYNTTDKRCERFYYGGCGGNSNNYLSEELCLQICGDVQPTVTIVPKEPVTEKPKIVQPEETTEKEEDTCKLPSITGECDKYEVRWYYNNTDQRCEPFYYGGCGGNSNNFLSEELCLHQCGDVIATVTSESKEPTTEKSEILQPIEKELEQGTCTMPFATGECDKYEIRWYYNSTDERCEQFYYGGCGGNSNNYLSEELCLQQCGDVKPIITSVPKEPITEKPEIVQPEEPKEEKEDTCKLPSLTGDCDKYEVRWYYNTTDQRCEPFYYGGCGGNSNNYLSEELCLQQCGDVKTTVLSISTKPTTEKPEILESKAPVEKEEDTCKLPSLTGKCDKYEVRWYYNNTDQRCERFYYGGCEGNSNNFLSEELCLQQCGDVKTTVTILPKEPITEKPEIHQPEKPVDKEQGTCTMPFATGECDKYEIRWYYNTTDQRCEQFYYGGCGGNSNNYMSEELCLQQCGDVKPTDKSVPKEPITEKPEIVEPEVPSEKELDTCSLPSSTGECDKYEIRWYYNNTDQRCERFYYGGCGGNSNNFLSEELCLQKCGDAEITPKSVPKEPITEKPEILQPNEPVEKEEDTCKLPSVTGECDKYEIRWYYNTTDQRCERFYYGGCGGNPNNFLSEELCLQQCGDVKTIVTSVPEKHITEEPKIVQPEEPAEREESTCQLPFAQGGCDDFKTRWYYNNSNQSCELFYYGGCGGNANNFISKKLCLQHCGGVKTTTLINMPEEGIIQKPDVPQTEKPFKIDYCLLPNDAGPCRNSSTTRFYYDSQDGVCKMFMYSGCEGNPNNYLTSEECHQKCNNVQDLCTLPKVTGPCRASFPRWYYNHNSNACLQFVFGGCLGNNNNFDTQELCEQKCLKSEAKPPQIPVTTMVPSAETVDICYTPVDVGSCNDTINAWYYNQQSQKCDTFVYGGCEGNANRFSSEEQCERHCGRFRGQDVCHHLVDPGICKKYRVKVYYDASEGSCKEFYYGGCNGNGNRFSSIEECEAICVTFKEKTSPTTVTTPHQVPVVVSINLSQNTFNEGEEISIPCEVIGYPTPSVIWSKDGQKIQLSEKVSITDSHKLIITGAKSTDTGNYRCDAENQYNRDSKSVNIRVEGIYIRPHCTDNPFFADCAKVVQDKNCSHKFFARFCCLSCTKAGQLPTKRKLDKNH